MAFIGSSSSSKKYTYQTSLETTAPGYDTVDGGSSKNSFAGVQANDLTLNQSDYGAIQAALQIATRAVDVAQKSNENVVGVATASSNAAQDAVSKSLANAQEANRSASENTTITVSRYAAIAAVLLGLVFVVARRRR